MSVLPILPFDEHGLLTRRAATVRGVVDSELRRLVRTGALVVVRRGVYADAQNWHALGPHRDKPLTRMRAAELSLRCKHVLSHDSAALVLGLGVPDPTNALVHITRRKSHGDACRAGVKHHLAPYEPRDVVEVEGLRVLAPARTALDMAREHGLVAGVAVADAALRSGASRADLSDVRGRMRCWPGSQVMDLAIELADPGAETWLESAGRVLVSSLDVGRPETQFGLTDGSRTVWCDLRIGRHVVEVDGMAKYDLDGRDPRRALRDEKVRQDFISGFKLGVSRLTAYDCGAGWEAARRRVRREYDDTCARFGTDVADLAAYRPRVPRRRAS